MGEEVEVRKLGTTRAGKGVSYSFFVGGHGLREVATWKGEFGPTVSLTWETLTAMRDFGRLLLMKADELQDEAEREGVA